MSTQNPEPEKQAAPAPPVISKSLMMMAGAGLSIPALIPLLVLVEPRLVPFIPPVESNGLTTTLFMVGLSVSFLALNWGFLYFAYRWLNKYAGAQ
ncbi:hypothetical protein [Bradymonas sediminis]|nr:hypothetical protein [Bradymonas sediminis]TDP75312.1 hypothetical protein DFR33_104177 [Bradymonas sediminis]